MNFTYASLDPVQVTHPGKCNAQHLRTFQGIPGIERTASGRLFAVWYTGGTSECRKNYVCMTVSDDNGATWSDTVAVVDPPHPDVRAFDATLWVSPAGTLHLFWAQGCGGEDGQYECYDGIAGVWVSILENPEADLSAFRFTPSRRICNGIMMNKPTVLGDGTWALPCALWSGGNWRKHDSLGVMPGAYMVVSTDRGKTFEVRGRIEVRDVEGGAEFDEHIFIERKDGSIVCYIRVAKGVAESISCDGGRTWGRAMLSPRIHGPSSRFLIRRLKSDRLLLVYNDSVGTRTKLTAWLSEDDGQSWPHKLLLDGREGVSYPDGTEAADGMLYIAYDRDRLQGGYILLARITETDILAGEVISPNSKLQMEIGHAKSI